MVYFWPENGLWVTHCNSCLAPPHSPHTHLVPRPDKPLLRNTCVGTEGGGLNTRVLLIITARLQDAESVCQEMSMFMH